VFFGLFQKRIAHKPNEIKGFTASSNNKPAPSRNGFIVSKSIDYYGGDGGNRNRVRKLIPETFYERSRSTEIPALCRRTAGCTAW